MGTIANVRKEKYTELGIDLRPNSSSATERLFMAIRKGDTPENNPVSAIIKDWMEEFMQANSIAVPVKEVVWK